VATRYKVCGTDAAQRSALYTSLPYAGITQVRFEGMISAVKAPLATFPYLAKPTVA